MTYSTQDLIRILDQELKAAWRGDRLLLSSEERVGVPIVTLALDTAQLGKVFVCQDFTQQIHQYQRDHQVSGIVWRELTVGDHRLRLPEIHQQLVAIAADKAILQGAKAAVLDFWWQATADLHFWQVTRTGVKPLSKDEVAQLAERAEWAELDIGRDEFYLALCWGKPKECHYRWAYPDSGCDRLIAGRREPQHLNIF